MRLIHLYLIDQIYHWRKDLLPDKCKHADDIYKDLEIKIERYAIMTNIHVHVHV